MKKLIILALSCTALIALPSCAAKTTAPVTKPEIVSKADYDDLLSKYIAAEDEITLLNEQLNYTPTPTNTPIPISALNSTNTSQSMQSPEMPTEIILSAGNYEVGSDIAFGKYDIEWIKGDGNFIVYNSEGTNIMAEMFGPSSDYYIKEFKNLILEQNDTVKVKDTLNVKLVKK